ncbi:hypothetical protein [Mycolicibacterium sp. S3B2]
MDSSELFSHRQGPQVAVSTTVSSEPVQAPVFSDQQRPTRSGDSPTT